MALKMTNREVDGVAVVALDGRIVLGEDACVLHRHLEAAERHDPRAESAMHVEQRGAAQRSAVHEKTSPPRASSRRR